MALFLIPIRAFVFSDFNVFENGLVQTFISLFPNRFERASIDIVKLEIEDIGNPTKIRIGHDGKGSRPDWFLERVQICLFLARALFIMIS